MAHLFNSFQTLKEKFSHADDVWEYTEEPHASRRKAILKKYPEIRKLMGYDPFVAYVVIAEVVAQVAMCYLVQNSSWGIVIFLAYVVGGTLNHSLASAMHEIGHNLAFGHGHPLMNRALGILSNLPVAVPMYVTYKRYHAVHHRFLGRDHVDMDVPTKTETLLFRHPITKCIWLFFNSFLHLLRPIIKDPKTPIFLEIVNIVCQIAFDAAVFYVFGQKALVYLTLGTFFGLGFHPLAGHFISEHYIFTKGQATHSYYGPLNPILFNVGYHVEHHDFPYIPFRKLPEVRRIAKEFYEDLPYHTSWIKVLHTFIVDPDMGPIAHGVGYRKEDCDIAKREAEDLKLVGADKVSKKEL